MTTNSPDQWLAWRSWMSWIRRLVEVQPKHFVSNKAPIKQKLTHHQWIPKAPTVW